MLVTSLLNCCKCNRNCDNKLFLLVSFCRNLHFQFSSDTDAPFPDVMKSGWMSELNTGPYVGKLTLNWIIPSQNYLKMEGHSKSSPNSDRKSSSCRFTFKRAKREKERRLKKSDEQGSSSSSSEDDTEVVAFQFDTIPLLVVFVLVL